MVLAPFAETKGARLPGRTPASINEASRRTTQQSNIHFEAGLMLYNPPFSSTEAN